MYTTLCRDKAVKKLLLQRGKEETYDFGEFGPKSRNIQVTIFLSIITTVGIWYSQSWPRNSDHDLTIFFKSYLTNEKIKNLTEQKNEICSEKGNRKDWMRTMKSTGTTIRKLLPTTWSSWLRRRFVSIYWIANRCGNRVRRSIQGHYTQRQATTGYRSNALHISQQQGSRTR